MVYTDKYINMVMSRINPYVQEIISFLSAMAIGLPENVWWLPAISLLILGLTALADAKTGHVPNVPLLFGFMLSIAVFGFYVDWSTAGYKLGLGITTALAIWAVNQAYKSISGKDALGMGDAKWSAVAIVNFGFVPVVFAWVVGAWLALFWMGLSRIAGMAGARRRGEYIRFAPFLFAGLCAGLYWKCFR